MLGSVNPREVLHSFDDVFHLCVRLHTAAAGVRDLERKFNAVADLCFSVVMLFMFYRTLPSSSNEDNLSAML